jgi:hypothetical protein
MGNYLKLVREASTLISTTNSQSIKIALCVRESDYNLTEEQCALLCSYVEKALEYVNTTDITLLVDVIVDLYVGLDVSYFNYRPSHYHLSEEDLRQFNKLDEVSDMFWHHRIVQRGPSHDINKSINRQLATKILKPFLYRGEFYYKLEDWITDVLDGKDTAPPLGIEGEHLMCALRLEVSDFVEAFEAEVDDEFIEECVEELINHHANVLDMNLIEEVVENKLNEEEESDDE